MLLITYSTANRPASRAAAKAKGKISNHLTMIALSGSRGRETRIGLTSIGMLTTASVCQSRVIICGVKRRVPIGLCRLSDSLRARV